MESFWTLLGVPPTTDERGIRRAYAQLLKQRRPEDDPAGFQALREAFEAALGHARANAPAATAPSTASVSGGAAPVHAALAENAMAEAVQGTDTVVAMPRGERVADVRENDRESAWRSAEPMWRAFLAEPQRDPAARLARLTGGASPLSLTGREALEVMAARHCAGDDCDPALRAAIVEHFGWHDDASHLRRLEEHTADWALGRYRADEALQMLRADAATSAAATALLADSTPRIALRLLSGSFVAEMRQLVQQIRWNAPELLHFHLDRDVFDWWERKVSGPRYTGSTLLLSLFGGLALCFLAAAVLGERARGNGGTIFLASMAGAFGLGAWLALRPPQALLARLRRLQGNRLAPLLHGSHGVLVQFGWIVPFILVSLAMFTREPGPLLSLVALTGMVACAAAAVLAASIALTPQGYLMIGVFGLLFGRYLGLDIFPDYGWPTNIALGVCVYTLLLHFELRLHLLGQYLRHLGAVRAAWLAGTAALLLSHHTLLPAAIVAPATWTWALLGIGVMRFDLRPLIALPAYFVLLRLGDSTGLFAPPFADFRLIGLNPLLLLVSVFMVHTLVAERRKSV